MNKNTGNVAKSSRLHRLPPQRGLLTGGAPAIPPAPHFAKGRNISFCAWLPRCFGPVFLEEVAQSHQPIDFGPGPQLAAENRGLQGFLGRAGVQTPQASAPVALVCLLGRARHASRIYNGGMCRPNVAALRKSDSAFHREIRSASRNAAGEWFARSGDLQLVTGNVLGIRLQIMRLRGRRRGPRFLE